MAKSPAERKAAQRKRQRSAGMVIPQWQIESEEHEMIKRNCVLRRPVVSHTTRPSIFRC